MPKPISAAETTSVRFVIVTLDNHLASATERARRGLRKDIPGLDLRFHAASDWNDPKALERCREDIAGANILVVTMMFMEEHADAILPAIEARRPQCDAVVCCMSAPQIVRLTRIGRFNMDGSKRGALDFLKRLRGGGKASDTGGARQLAMLRRIPRILRFIPGPAQDVRAYFLTLQYWLGGSDDNVANLVRFLVSRYAGGERAQAFRRLKARLPIEYPEIGVYHPRLPGRVGEAKEQLPAQDRSRGTIGLLLMRSYILANNCAHYDAVIDAFEQQGFAVVPAFASGLDARPAIERFFLRDGAPAIDALVSLTGFSLVGGPAFNDAKAAEETLAKLDAPYVAAQALEFQTIEQWEESQRGLSPIEATMMVAIPELDGAINPMVFAGRSSRAQNGASRDIVPHRERIGKLVERVARLIALRRKPASERKLAVTLFNFPPNAGNVGTAAFLAVFASLHNLLRRLREEGYQVDLPESVDALRERILCGNASRFGASANVHARVSANAHMRGETWLEEIERQWGPAPGRQNSDGASIHILGERFGNVFVGVQPGFGCEGDPMRLLFERGFAPTHAFSAFYRFIREDFGADAVLHFGTHGALEFMPGKQVGLSGECWPDRLIGALPNIYLYAANNPSEGAIARRRSAATLVSYLTPSVTQAGLYRGLIDLKASVERFRACDCAEERARLAALIQAQASAVDLAQAEPAWGEQATHIIAELANTILEVEYSLIPDGLHVLGEPMSAQERVETLSAIAETRHGLQDARALAQAIVEETPAPSGVPSDALAQLAETNRLLTQDHELPALLRALEGRYIRPVAGGDLMRTPDILPTGRNLHGFDPMRIPSAFAIEDGVRQAERVLARHLADGNPPPEQVALVLWGTDNLKSEGAPIAQALAFLGARPRFDAYGRLSGAMLLPLATLGRPRIDVIVTLSGIFRDLLPQQTRLLAEACFLAASADEPEALNFVRKHALAHQARHGCDLETAALRVFSNAEGAYGANVGMLVDSANWSDPDELSEVYSRRKCFAYDRRGQAARQADLLQAVMAQVDLTYQNLDSVELGVTSIDHYFDSLGGMGRSVARARGASVPIYISDQTCGEGKVRSLSEQVSLETRTRMLNPKWSESMLQFGYEGVRQIEAHLTNTVGWSATTGQVDPWVYEQITRTYVLDADMRKRLAELNPTASTKLVQRVMEAHQRGYWSPDATMLAALQDAGDELEDRLEGVATEVAA